MTLPVHALLMIAAVAWLVTGIGLVLALTAPAGPARSQGLLLAASALAISGTAAGWPYDVEHGRWLGMVLLLSALAAHWRDWQPTRGRTSTPEAGPSA
jgi:hypothetical protein